MERGRSDAYRTPDVSITMRCFAGAVRRFVARFTGVEDDLTTIAWKYDRRKYGDTHKLVVARCEATNKEAAATLISNRCDPRRYEKPRR